MRLDVRENPADAYHSVVRADTGESLDSMMIIMADDETGEYVRYADRGMPGHIAIDDHGEPLVESGVFDFPIRLVRIDPGSHRENPGQEISGTP